MDGPLKPRTHGSQFVGPPVDEHGRIPKKELRAGAARGLSEMLDEYAFFTPAILYLHGGFRDAPLIDFMYEMRTDVTFYYRKFSRPVFRGLEAQSNSDPAWNFALWALRREYFEAFSDFLVSLTLTYADEKTAAGVGEQVIEVPDPLRAERAVLYDPTMATVPVSVFGINGSRYRAAMAVSNRPFAEPPVLRFYAADPTMVTFAQALYCGVNPIDARSGHRREIEGTTHEGDSRLQS